MSLPKLLALVSCLLLALIGVGIVVKKAKAADKKVAALLSAPEEVELSHDIVLATQVHQSPQLQPQASNSITPTSNQPAEKVLPSASLQQDKAVYLSSTVEDNGPTVDRIAEFFNKSEPRLSFVETITYHSRADWLKGRPAWLADYAAHYQTSRHFIARSLHGKPDYFKQEVVEGDRFNVFCLDKQIQFYLLVDLSRCKMWFYSYDRDSRERILIKTYTVGLGRIDSSSPSGSLTPLGSYSLGNKIAIYKPNMKDFHHGEKVEMIRIFGSRWIPFDRELEGTTAPSKGLGIHGVPWVQNEKGELCEDSLSLGKYNSDGCIRLATADMEELFSIIITKPTTLLLVKDFHRALLPGFEKKENEENSSK